MSEREPKSAEDQPELSQKQVDRMLAIDAACDGAANDFEAITNSLSLILQAVEAEVGLLSWVDPDTHRLDSRSLSRAISYLVYAHGGHTPSASTI